METQHQMICDQTCEVCTSSETPWECQSCQYQYGDAPPKGLACLRCRQVADFFSRVREEKKPVDLLDQLHALVGCEYLSNMKEPQWRPTLLRVIGEMDQTAFAPQQWSSALSYLFEETIVVDSMEDLQTFLNGRTKA